MKFRHITTWTPNLINFGKVYETNWSESNYWLHKQTNETLIENNINTLFETIQVVLKALGKSFDFSELSAEMQKSKYYAELLKEYIFEETRIREFSEKPSRKKCMFLVPYEVDFRILFQPSIRFIK